MQQQFEESTRQTPNTDMGLRHDEPQSRTTSRTRAGGINFALIAIFAVPLLLITGLLQASKRYVDVLDGGENLEALVKQAKEAGYPFEASELAVKGVPDSNNGYIPLKKYFLDKDNPVPKGISETSDYSFLDKKELDPNVAELIRRAKLVAANTQFNNNRDYDQSLALLYPEYAPLKSITRALAYDAAHRARHGDDAGAIQSLRLARNPALQLSNDKPLLSVLVNVSCQSIFYRAVGNVAHEMRGRPSSLKKLFALTEQSIPTVDFEESMKVEFYLALSFFRNSNPTQYAFANLEEMYNSFDKALQSDSLIRQGLPKSAIAQSLLAKYIRQTLELRATRKKTPNHLVETISQEEANLIKPEKISQRILTNLSPYYADAGSEHLLLPSYRELARWAIQIAMDHPNGYPETLPSRSDSALGGTLRYRKQGKYYSIYSTGLDKTDNGGPWNAVGESNPDKGDDFGMFLPIKPKEPIKSSGAPLPPRS